MSSYNKSKIKGYVRTIEFAMHRYLRNKRKFEIHETQRFGMVKYAMGIAKDYGEKKKK